MSPEIVAGQRMAYTREEYLRLADEYLNDAIVRLQGTTTIEQSIEIAEVFALMALATRDSPDEDPGTQAVLAASKAAHPANRDWVPHLEQT